MVAFNCKLVSTPVRMNQRKGTGSTEFLIQYLMSLFLCLSLNCHPYIKETKIPEDYIRVAIATGVNNFTFSSPGSFKVISKEKYLKVGSNKIDVTITDSVINLRLARGLARIYDSVIYFIPESKIFRLGNRNYRGVLVFRSVQGQNFLINILTIEEYLQGVVPSEMGQIDRELFEAIKAQAVAARTYAYAHKGKYDNFGFDVYATVQDQVYDGMNVESELVNRAIKKTKDQILVYQREPIEAKYHSTCGGRTANFSDIWGDSSPPYLTSVDDPFCKQSPHYRWETDISFSQLMKSLGYDSLRNERIKAIKLKRSTETGRVIEITVITSLREEKIPKWKIRKVLAGEESLTGMLKSTYFDMKVTNGKIKINGRGHGHGVGMCQYGAMGMARAGYNYKKILKHYYPNTRLTRK